MPIYEYKCPEHGVFEELRPMSESEKTAKCSECGKVCKRIFSLCARTPEKWKSHWDDGLNRHKGSVPDSIKERHS